MNCQVLGDAITRRAIVVDPGDELDRILNCLERNKLKVAQVVFTHAHIDHVGAAAGLLRHSPAPVAMHAADEPLYSRLDMQAQWSGAPVPERVRIDRYLEEGDAVTVDDIRLEVLFTPGHSPGSVSLYLPGEQKVLAGDALFQGSIGRTDLPGGDHAQLLASIRAKLFTLPDETAVYPGHGPTTTIGQEKRTNPFFR
jgi:hydroxyacylglutathione hydrolase